MWLYQRFLAYLKREHEARQAESSANWERYALIFALAAIGFGVIAAVPRYESLRGYCLTVAVFFVFAAILDMFYAWRARRRRR